jgi:periplasmic divalent cation tolerance protein
MLPLLVLTTINTLDDAKLIARSLIAKQLCACVNITPSNSIYQWQGSIEETEEYMLLIKTDTSRYQLLEAEIKVLHKYELPEIIAIEISAGSQEYLAYLGHAIT